MVCHVFVVQQAMVYDIKQNENNDQDMLFNPDIHGRGSSNIFECDKCSLTGDIHFMKQHICSKILCT